jgi:hypothetical protein
MRASLATAATTRARSRRRRRNIAPIAGAAAVTLSVCTAIGWPSADVNVVEKANAALTAAPNTILHIRAMRTTDATHQTTEIVEQWEESDPLRGRIWIRSSSAPTGGTQFAYDNDYYQRGQTLNANGQPPMSADPVAGIKRLLENGQLADVGEVTVGGRTLRRFQGTIDDAHAQQRLVYDVDPDSYQPVVARITLTARVNGVLRPADAMTVTTQYQVVEDLPATAGNERLLQVDDGAQTPPKEGTRR